MSQLVLCRVRDDGDYDTIAAVQETDCPPTPALQWILQMHEYMTSDNENDIFVIFRLDDLTDVLSFSGNSPIDLTWLCENQFNTGATQLGEKILVDKAMGFTHDKKENLSVDWYTPPSIFKSLGLQFDLDPCAPVGGVPWIPATRYFSLADDGLSQHWEGLVWLNPPYGKHTPQWMDKMHRHRNGVALVFARTDCKWFHESVAKADAILFLKGRIRFVDGLGVSGGGGAGCGSMLVAWGEVSVNALKRMEHEGFLMETKPNPTTPTRPEGEKK